MTAAGPYRPLVAARRAFVAHRCTRIARPGVHRPAVKLVWCWHCSRYVTGPAGIHELAAHDKVAP